MKQLILSYLFLFFISSGISAQDSIPSNAGTRPADAAYNEGNYDLSIDLLEKEKADQLAKGLESSALYYNLGNAYYRSNEIAKARLYYEKALLLDPGDRDIRHNIDYLMTKIEDKILVADTFFLGIWFNAVQNLFSSDTWATLAVVTFILLIAALVLFFFSSRVFYKKVAFYSGIVLVVIVIFANIFSYNQKSKIEHRSTAVIMAGSIPIVSSPDMNSKELFILHAGTKVFITKEDRNWVEIEIDNGSVGWIQKDKLEVI